MEKDRRINFDLPDEMHHEMRRAAFELDTKLAVICRTMCRQFLDMNPAEQREILERRPNE